MAIFKCKMCSGELDVQEGITVLECEYCGTKQTVPTADDEGLHSLFNRANILRKKGEFDKAADIYEKIIHIKNNESEAYWGLILCKYGIEYVEDPTTFKRIPTCHRTSFDSIVTDVDYALALQYADGVQKSIYEAEAKEIDRLQKEILTLSQKEDPYDVFICYKETAPSGERTQDSVIANEIYYQLTQEGMKVFYASITLEDKLGSAYEPCIFAALNSSKVMLVIGTKPEYFNAVWVKNEWSRFLKLMKNDRSKLLIPCYKEMDAYELPEEFAHLQAQDMTKIGFINDIVRGINKLIKKESAPMTSAAATAHNAANNVSIDPLLERVFMFLEDGEWQSADEYCEKVLDMDPKNGRAYVGKLMAHLKVSTLGGLSDINTPIDGINHYQKAIKFGNEELISELTSISETINNNIALIQKKNSYNNALRLLRDTTSIDELERIRLTFISFGDFMDAPNLVAECNELIKNKKITKAQTIIENALGSEDIEKARDLLSDISSFEGVDELLRRCDTEFENRKAYAYKLCEEYEIISTQIESSICEIKKQTSLLDSQKNELYELNNKLKLNKKTIDKLRSLENEQKKIDKTLIDLKDEISSLGIFSGVKKKQLSHRIDYYERLRSEKSEEIQRIIAESDPYNYENTLLTSIDEQEKLISKTKDIINSLHDNIDSYKNSQKAIAEKIATRNVISAVYDDPDKVVSVLNNSSVRAYMKKDKELLKYITETDTYKNYMPTLKNIFLGNDVYLDAEAIYYQACEALDLARSKEDVEWAMSQFNTIPSYKNSIQKIAECSNKLLLYR